MQPKPVGFVQKQKHKQKKAARKKMAEESDKVTAESYGCLHNEDVGNECWMLRIPPKLAAAWDKMPEGTVLGELVFRRGQKAAPGKQVVKPAIEVHAAPPQVEEDDPAGAAAAASLPLQYSLAAMTKKLPTLHPFSRHPNGSIKLHGTVTRTANLQVVQDASYRELCKNRIMQTSVNKKSYVRPVESNQVVQQSNRKQHTKGFGAAVHQYGKRLLEAANQPNTPAKRTKFDVDQPTKSVIFQLFSQQPYWTVKDLKVASGGRPETEIRDVLREIGDFHRSGDHKNTWELRKEFQNKST